MVSGIMLYYLAKTQSLECVFAILKKSYNVKAIIPSAIHGLFLHTLTLNLTKKKQILYFCQIVG